MALFSGVNIKDISGAIDRLLKNDNWTQKHMDFYDMLCTKVNVYKTNARRYNEFKDDVPNLIMNVKEQHWFRMKPSIEQSVVLDTIRNIRVKKINISDKSQSIVIDMPNDVTFTVKYIATPLSCNISFSRNNITGYAVRYGNNIGYLRLPEYEKLEEVLPTLKRSDIIHIANELIIYYDTKKLICKVPIGNDYPVTLKQLAHKSWEKTYAEMAEMDEMV